MGVLGPDNELLLRMMRATSLQGRIASENVANLNTPGYTRRVVRFQDTLQEALQSGDRQAADVVPEIVEDRETPARPDGNNVLLELELNSLRESRLLYDAYSSILSGHFEVLRTSIKDGT
jgi:flagellar basal-body rod protein FlgB